MSALASLFCLPLFTTVACGSDEPDEGAYDTFQGCFDDHHVVEASPVNESIKICCIDHPIGVPPIGPNVVCGETSAACQAFLDANLDGPSATVTEIVTACNQYIVDRAS